MQREISRMTSRALGKSGVSEMDLDYARSMVMEMMSGPSLKALEGPEITALHTGLKLDLKNALEADEAETAKFCEQLLEEVEREVESRGKNG